MCHISKPATFYLAIYSTCRINPLDLSAIGSTDRTIFWNHPIILMSSRAFIYKDNLTVSNKHKDRLMPSTMSICRRNLITMMHLSHRKEHHSINTYSPSIRITCCACLPQVSTKNKQPNSEQHQCKNVLSTLINK